MSLAFVFNGAELAKLLTQCILKIALVLLVLCARPSKNQTHCQQKFRKQVGAGQVSPQLHNPDYDFPDGLIPVGRDLFLDIIRQLNGFS